MTQLNLLPASRKEILRFRMHRSFSLRMFIALLFVLVVFDTLLVNTLIVLNFSVRGAEEAQISSEIKAKEEEIAALDERIKQGKTRLSEIAPYAAPKPSVISEISDIVQLVPENARVTSLVFDTSSRRVSLSGFAPTRSVVLSLSDNLRNNPRVSKLEFPAANIYPERDITFHTNFILK